MTRDLSSPAVGLDVQSLLTIDVASELRKLSQAQLEGPWQLPAELVRRAIRGGAQKVLVRFGGGQVVVQDDGPGLDPSLLHWTAVLVDRQRPAQERHRALATLEAAGELALLTMAGMDQLRALHIDASAGPQRHQLIFQEGSAPTLAAAPAGSPPGNTIRLRLHGLERRRASRWLADVARFSPVPVMVDGAAVAAGWADSLATRTLALPLRGRVAILRQGDTGHAYLLAHGVVTAHLTVPDAPCFEAAVELGGISGEHTPSRLREAVGPLLPALIDQTVDLLIGTAARLASWPERDRVRLARLVLEAVRLGLRLPELERLSLFRTVSVAGPRLLDLLGLRGAAASEGTGTLQALSPGQRLGIHALGSEPVLLADEAERSLLADVLNVRFRAPLRRESAYSLRATVRRVSRLVRRGLASGLDLLRHPWRRPALPENALVPDERALLVALRAHLQAQPGGGPGDAVLCAGQGPLRRRQRKGGAPLLVLPRENPTVQACVRAIKTDPQWMRLVHLALVGGAAGRSRRTS